LDRTDRSHAEIRRTIEGIKARWQPDELPKDLRRLAQHLVDLAVSPDLRHLDICSAVDEAPAAGTGAGRASGERGQR
jgi:hypothetical protein